MSQSPVLERGLPSRAVRDSSGLEQPYRPGVLRPVRYPHLLLRSVETLDAALVPSSQ